MEIKLNSLKTLEGATKKRKRIGRGSASGTGGTSGRGHKGQKSRAGGVGKPGFEGGQTPFYKRISHFPGFKNAFSKNYQTINIGKFNVFEEGSVITPQEMYNSGLIADENKKVKILGSGELSKQLVIKAHAFSKKALTQIESLNGKGEII